MRALRLAWTALLVGLGLLWGQAVQAQQTEKRIALVIGNGAYAAGKLATPANDAGLIAQTLQAAGFDVAGARDLDAATLRAALREFVDKAAASGPDTVALIYFAGHGLQFEGENYLAPVDARMLRDSDVPLEAVRVTDLTKPLASLPLKGRIVILDAARAHSFGKAGQPLAGGLALMQPDAGTLIAFNAAPGTIGADKTEGYGAYALALSEMIREGGLPLDALFERVRLRVNDLTKGAQLPWQVSRFNAPFLFFEHTNAAPQPKPDRFAELATKPIPDFEAHDAYLAAVARDTLRGYGEFLAAFPNDQQAKRVRAIIAARREAATWRETSLVDSQEAYWSYLRRYPRGPHSGDARRRLAHYAASLEPPLAFAPITYDIEPPLLDELTYVERQYVAFADPDYDLPPPPMPLFYLPLQPVYIIALPPPPPPLYDYFLPVPIYRPVPIWVERPAYVVAPPVNVIYVNIHNNVVINQTTQSATVTNAAGQLVPAFAPGAAPLPPPVAPPAPGASAPNFIQAHPAASALIGAAAVALPAAALLRARQQPAIPVNVPGQPLAPSPGQIVPRGPAPLPGAPGRTLPGQPRLPAPAANVQPPALQQLRPGLPPALPAKGALPLPVPAAPPAASVQPQPSLQRPAALPGAPALKPAPPDASPLAAPAIVRQRPPASAAPIVPQAARPQIPAQPGAQPPAIVRRPPPSPAPQAAPAVNQQLQIQQQAERQRQQQQLNQQRQNQENAQRQQQQQAAQQRQQQLIQQQGAQRQQQLLQQQQQAAQQRQQQQLIQQQRQQQAAPPRPQQAAPPPQGRQPPRCGLPGLPPCPR